MTILITLILLLAMYHFLVFLPKIDALKDSLTAQQNINFFNNCEHTEQIKKEIETDIIKLSNLIKEHNQTGKDLIKKIEEQIKDSQR